MASVKENERGQLRWRIIHKGYEKVRNKQTRDNKGWGETEIIRDGRQRE